MKIKDFTTLTFDCYGTLIDWESGIYNALKHAVDMEDPNPTKDEVLLRYAKVEAKVEHEQPNLKYTHLLREVHRRFTEDYNISATEDDHERFGDSIRDWPAFADSVESLNYLKQHFKLVILSNVDNIGFSYSNNHLQVEFDAIFTAEDIGSYKPQLNNFDYMLDHLAEMGVEKTNILHTAQSLYHDMVPATQVGLTRCWIDRRSGQQGSGATPRVEEPVEVHFRFESLAAMVEAHKEELQNS